MERVFLTIGLLLISNTFMTMAWYGHLKFKEFPLGCTILVCWLLALPEYCFQVPANRIGHGVMSAPQLKITQEVISILAFLVFNYLYLKEAVLPSDWVSFGLILGAVLVYCVPRLGGN
jgi:hypothetical protein